MCRPPSMRTEFDGLQRHHGVIGMRRSEKYPVHAIKTKIMQQPLEPGHRARQVQIMSHPVFQRHAGDPWLLRIDFPWMEVKNAGGLLLPVDTTQATLEHRIRQQAEITTATAGPVTPPAVHRRHRDFEQSGTSGEKWKSRRSRHAIQVMMDRHDAGAVAVASLAQFLMGPQRARANRIAGCAVAVHRRAGDVFQQVFGTGNALAKFAATQSGQALMAKTVACDLMATGADVAHERRKAFCHPAEYKERGVHFVTSKKLQDAPRVVLDTDGPARPILAPDAVLEGGHLKIVLDIHGHGVDDGLA